MWLEHGSILATPGQMDALYLPHSSKFCPNRITVASRLSFYASSRYGLVVNLLSDSGLGSLITTIRYFIRGPQRRAGVTSLLTHVFGTILLIYILTNAIGYVMKLANLNISSDTHFPFAVLSTCGSML